ncbi:unnamed protein product [Dovyalis caffra]|uniref:Uncharacterized protein n=1 Tax=Dovyalis caffra TaxID=77055 RepID=A0AAV1RKF2_9ROSI|nr:unnamed protein product [Dovyalis caffra]
MVGKDKAVKISVSEYQSLLNYKPGTDEITIAVASESCPEEDLKAIESHCQLLDYSYEGRQKAEDVNSGESSTGTCNDGAAGPQWKDTHIPVRCEICGRRMKGYISQVISKEVKVISTTTNGDNKVVKIAVSE